MNEIDFEKWATFGAISQPYTHEPQLHPELLQPKPVSMGRRIFNAVRGRPDKLFDPGQPHIYFEVKGRKFVYVYIRKNACSSMIRFIDQIRGGRGGDHQELIDRLRIYSPVHSFQQLRVTFYLRWQLSRILEISIHTAVLKSIAFGQLLTISSLAPPISIKRPKLCSELTWRMNFSQRRRTRLAI